MYDEATQGQAMRATRHSKEFGPQLTRDAAMRVVEEPARPMVLVPGKNMSINAT